MPQGIPDIKRASNTAPTSSHTPPIAMSSSLCRTTTPKDAPRLINSLTIHAADVDADGDTATGAFFVDDPRSAPS